MKNNFGNRDSYIDFMTAMFNCEISGMNAENKQREIQGDSMAYTEDSFYEVGKRYQGLFDEYVKNLKRGIT